MKQIFLLIIFTLFTLNSFAQIGEPVQITNPDDPVKFAGQNGFRVIGDNIYVTYLQNDNVIFAFSDNNGLDFEETEIDACYTNVLDRDTEPILEVLSDGTVIIIYLSKEIEDQVAYNYLKKAVGNTDGEFEIEIIEFNVFEKPTMTNSEDVITLFYKIGSSRSLSEYVYFSLSEESENADYSQESATVKFWGPDILDGPVHSNTDIWIQQGGGGNNEGFPTFNGFVTTSGIFRNYNQGGAPLSDAVKEIMFLGEPYPGYEELATPVEFSETAEDAHMNGIHIGEDADILYVKLEGQNYVSKVANIEFTGLEEFEVYSWFPTDAGLADAIVGMGGNWFEDSDNIWTNHIAIYDTVWSDGPSGVISGNSYFVDCELWIEGVVEGATTFACSDTVFIVGDITYENTIVGEDPDDPDNMNLSDYFGLISEEKILIRYKHRDPFEEMRIRDDNCDDINIYGAYAAIGKGNFEMYGDANCHHEGIITFQYHHPHGSTPDYRAMSPYNGQDTLYSYIDFHKFIFPAHPYVQPEYSGFKLHSNNPDMSGLICGYPIESQGFPDPYGYNSSYPNNTPYTAFPYGTDYPWYNPVWPESSSDIFFDRGDLNIWGSLIQTRRGYIHRSGNDGYNHGEYTSDENSDCGACLYDFENHLYGGSHLPTGYEKNYTSDSRFKHTSPPDFPMCFQGEQRIVVLRSGNSCENFSVVYNEEVPLGTQIICSDAKDENVSVWYRSKTELHELFSNDFGQTFELQEIDQEIYPADLQNAELSGNEIFLHVRTSNEFADLDKIFTSAFYDSEVVLSESFDGIGDVTFTDFNITNSDDKTMLWTFDSDPGEEGPGFYYTSENDEFDNFMYWEPEILIDNLNFDESFMSIRFNEADSVYIMLYKVSDDEQRGNLFLYSGRLNGITVNAETEIPAADFNLSLFPNPFNPSLSIQFNVSRKDAGDEKISIYNIKGQKVKSYSHPELVEGSVIWEGTDENGKRVSSGTYFIKLSDGKKKIIRKAVMIK